MPNETYIELEDMDATPCQWVLSYGDLRHIGYVQKSTGFIQLIAHVEPEVVASIKMQVEDSLEKSDLPVGTLPKIDIPGEEDE